VRARSFSAEEEFEKQTVAAKRRLIVAAFISRKSTRAKFGAASKVFNSDAPQQITQIAFFSKLIVRRW